MANSKLTVVSVSVFGLTLVAMAIGGVIGRWGGDEVSRTLFDPEPSTADVCEGIAKRTTKSHSEQEFHDGMLQGDEVVCDNTTVVYRYSFPEIVADHEVFEAAKFDKKAATPKLRKAYCGRMQSLVKQGIAARWEYRDRNGVPLYHVLMRPTDCTNESG